MSNEKPEEVDPSRYEEEEEKGENTDKKKQRKKNIVLNSQERTRVKEEKSLHKELKEDRLAVDFFQGSTKMNGGT